MFRINRITRFRTEDDSEYSDLDFKYIIEVPRCDCILGSTRHKTNGKEYIFLVFNLEDRIYKRNGMAWEEVSSPDHYWAIRQLISDAIRDQHVPCYRVNNFKII